jgi:hypothetical protein
MWPDPATVQIPDLATMQIPDLQPWTYHCIYTKKQYHFRGVLWPCGRARPQLQPPQALTRQSRTGLSPPASAMFITNKKVELV